MFYKVTIAIPEDTKTLFPSAAIEESENVRQQFAHLLGPIWSTLHSHESQQRFFSIKLLLVSNSIERPHKTNLNPFAWGGYERITTGDTGVGGQRELSHTDCWQWKWNKSHCQCVPVRTKLKRKHRADWLLKPLCFDHWTVIYASLSLVIITPSVLITYETIRNQSHIISIYLQTLLTWVTV